MNSDKPTFAELTILYQDFMTKVQNYINSNPSSNSTQYKNVMTYKRSVETTYNFINPNSSSGSGSSSGQVHVYDGNEFINVVKAKDDYDNEPDETKLTYLYNILTDLLSIYKKLPIDKKIGSEIISVNTIQTNAVKQDAEYQISGVPINTFEELSEKYNLYINPPYASDNIYNEYVMYRNFNRIYNRFMKGTNTPANVNSANTMKNTVNQKHSERELSQYEKVINAFNSYKNETNQALWNFEYDTLGNEITYFETSTPVSQKTPAQSIEVAKLKTEAISLNQSRGAIQGYSSELMSHTPEENKDYCMYTYGAVNISGNTAKPPTYPNLPPYLTYTGCNTDSRCVVGNVINLSLDVCTARNDPLLYDRVTAKPDLRDVDSTAGKVPLSTARLTIDKDEQLISPNGLWAGIMQSDGNFVIYARKRYNGELYAPARWATNTSVSPSPANVRIRFDPAVGGFNVDHYSTILNGWVQKWEQIHAGVGATIEDARNWGGPNKKAFITDNGDLEIQEASGFRVWNSSGSVDTYKCLHQLRNINGSVATMSGVNSLPNPNDIPNSHKQLMNQVVADGYIGYVYNKSNKTYRFLQNGSSVTLSTFDGLDTYLITSRSENLVNFYWYDGPMYMGTGQNILASTLDSQVKQKVEECARLSYDTAMASGFVYNPLTKDCILTGDVITDGAVWGQNQGYMSGWKVTQPAYDLPGYNSIKNNFEAYRDETNSGNFAVRYWALANSIANFKTENVGKTTRSQYLQVLSWETQANALNATRSAPTQYTPDQNDYYCKKYNSNDQRSLDYTGCNADERCVVTDGYFSPYNCNGRNNMMIGADFGLFARPYLTNYSADLSPAPPGITYTPVENFAYCQQKYPSTQTLNYTKCNADPRCVVSKGKIVGVGNSNYKCNARNTSLTAEDIFPALTNETAANYFPIPWVPPTPPGQPPFRIDVPAGVYNWTQFSEMRNVNATFIMQGDGNLVSYLNGVSVVVIQSGHPGAKAYMSTNEMSITDGASNWYWVSGKGATYNNQYSRVLYLRPDAHLDIYYHDIGDTNKVWSSIEWCRSDYHLNRGSLSKQFMIKQYNGSVPSISQGLCLGIDSGTIANNTPVKSYNNISTLSNLAYWQLVPVDISEKLYYIKLENSPWYLAYDNTTRNLRLVDQNNRTYTTTTFLGGGVRTYDAAKWYVSSTFTDNYSISIMCSGDDLNFRGMGITFSANGSQATVSYPPSLINLTW